MDNLHDAKPEPERKGLDSSQWTVIGLAVAFAAGSFLYRLLRHVHLGQSAAMFLGVPVVLAVLVALTPKVKTVTGGIVKAITLALLIVAPLLGEGYLCILIAAPLFYAVGIIVGLLVDWAKRPRKTTVSCVGLLLLPMCLEGTIPELTFDRAETVTATRTIAASATNVERALARSPDVSTKQLPLYLRIGFPRPLTASGQGLDPGSLRTIHFSGAEGDPPGDLVMRVTERHPSSVRFETVSDGSKLTQWLRWESSDVSWQQLDRDHTRVTWKVSFTRQLDPAWYFVPWERATVREAASFLITANAQPTEKDR